jgi:hypothetical protein
MAYQNPAFYFYHNARESQDARGVPAPTASSGFSLFDDRQGEVFAFEAMGDDILLSDRVQNATNDAVDTLIVSGHNWNGLDVRVRALIKGDEGNNPQVMRALATIIEADGVPIIMPLTPALSDPWDEFEIKVEAPASLAELTEMMFTTKRELTRGPEPNWQHPWARTQRQFLSEGGVSSTWITGANRKRYRLTWRHLVGADRQVFLDLREQSDGWSRPFFFRPPDDTYDTILMELDRDSDWVQDFDSPLDSGTSDAITMPLIEVLG